MNVKAMLRMLNMMKIKTDERNNEGDEHEDNHKPFEKAMHMMTSTSMIKIKKNDKKERNLMKNVMKIMKLKKTET